MGSILMGSFMGSTHEMVDQAYVFLAICSSSFGIESKPLFFGGGQVYGIQHFFRQSGILFAYLVYVWCWNLKNHGSSIDHDGSMIPNQNLQLNTLSSSRDTSWGHVTCQDGDQMFVDAKFPECWSKTLQRIKLFESEFPTCLNLNFKMVFFLSSLRQTSTIKSSNSFKFCIVRGKNGKHVRWRFRKKQVCWNLHYKIYKNIFTRKVLLSVISEVGTLDHLWRAAIGDHEKKWWEDA